MIDIHSHILPGVDDGAKDLVEALEMLRRSADQGVKTQVLTPHIHLGRYDNTKRYLSAQFERFVEEVAGTNIKINLRLAAEVRIGPELMALVQQDQIPWMGEYQGKKTFLLEFPRIEVPHGSDNLVRWLLQKDIVPIIVHPERNKTFLNHPQKLQVFIDLGCPLQVTASSLTGKFGDDVQAFALGLLEKDQVFAIASDCHNLKGRAPDLARCLDELKPKFSNEQIDKWFTHNPASLFNQGFHPNLVSVPN